MSALNKTILREIKGTFGRFISILCLIALGVFAYVGISVTGSDMRMTGIDYSNKYNLADIFIQSTYGLDEDDQKTLESFPELTLIEYGYSTDVTMTRMGEKSDEEQVTLKIESLPKTLSTYEIIEGRLPENDKEIILDNKFKFTEQYEIGDEIEFVKTNNDDTSLDNLKQTAYKIVGFANSPEYLTKSERGQSFTGKGEIYAFGAILPENFDMEIYTIARASADVINESNVEKTTYDDNITTRVESVKDQIDFKNLANNRLQKLKDEIETELNDAETKIADGKKELSDNEQKLKDSEVELEDAKGEYYSGLSEFETQISEQEALLTSSEQTLVYAKQELDKAASELEYAASEIAKGEQQMQQGETELNAAMAEWQQGYDEFLEQKALFEENETLYLQGVESYERGLEQWELAQADLDERIANEGLTPALIAEQQILDGQKIILDQTKIELDATGVQIEVARTELLTAEATLDGAKAILDEKFSELAVGKAKIEESKIQYEQGKKLYEENLQLYLQGKSEIENGWTLLNQGKAEGQQTLAEAWSLILDGEQKLKEGFDLFYEEKPKAEKELAKAETEVKDARKTLDELEEPTYLVQSRNNLVGYDQFFDNGERLDVLAYIFPVFLFFVAALVTLTTMTRMVEEQRTQIGTLKALGYSQKDIMRKYITYGTISGGLGTLIGIFMGLEMLPRLIYSAYETMYIFNDLSTKFYISYVLIGVFIAVLCTVIPAIYSVRESLKEKTTELMRPKAPKVGKRILLERATFIWSRLSFNYKVTARNLFRYKQRMLMTVLGVSGCIALIIMGIGIRDSLNATIRVQLDELYLYDVSATFNPDAEIADLKAYDDVIKNESNINNSLKVINDTIDLSQTGKANEELTLVVPQKTEKLNDFISLKDTKGNPLIVDNTGVVLSQKVAEVYKVKAGDEITLVSDNKEYTAKVAAINQWYMGHQIVIAPDYYETIFGKKPDFNTYLLTVKDESKVPTTLSALNVQPANILAMTLGSTTEIVEENMNGLNLVMLVLLLLAVLLAIIVLYNLTNINISERIRELSTIKVLGFYPKEVTLYIYRETLILTAIGIVVGWFLGTALEQFIVIQIPPSMVMFHRDILWTNYLIASIVTFAIALAIMIVMHIKLKRVDMIEALKSVE